MKKIGATRFPMRQLRELCSRISSGGTPSRRMPDYYQVSGCGIRWVKSKELLDCAISRTEEDISESGLQNSSAKLYPRNTVLLAMYGANVGQLGWLRRECSINQAICGMIIDPNKSAFRYLSFRKYQAAQVARFRWFSSCRSQFV